MIKTRRKELKMSQKTLGEHLGVSRSYISLIENNNKYQKKLGVELARKIAEELKLCPYGVFGYLSHSPRLCNFQCAYNKDGKCNADKAR